MPKYSNDGLLHEICKFRDLMVALEISRKVPHETRQYLLD